MLLVAGGGFFVVPVSAAAGIGEKAVPGVLLASGVGGFAGVLVAGRISNRWPTFALPVTALALAAATDGMGMYWGTIVYVIMVTVWGALIGVLPVIAGAVATVAIVPFALLHSRAVKFSEELVGAVGVSLPGN